MTKVRHTLSSATILVIAGLTSCSQQNDIQRYEAVLTFEIEQNESEHVSSELMAKVLPIVRYRVNETNSGDNPIIMLDDSKLEVSIPDLTDVEKVKSVITKNADLAFHLVHPASDDPVALNLAANKGQLPPVSYYIPSVDGGGLIVHPPSRITGDCIFKSEAMPHTDHGSTNVINFSFNAKCSQAFAEMTSANISRRFAVVLNDEIITAPTIRSEIVSGQGFIEGAFTKPEAEELAILLNSGRLPARVNLVEVKTFSE